MDELISLRLEYLSTIRKYDQIEEKQKNIYNNDEGG
jgi:hypothetical protein